MDENPEVAACGPKLLNPDRSVQHCIRHFPGPGALMLQEKLVDGSRFPSCPLLPKYSQFKCVGKLRFAESRQDKNRFGPHQGRRRSGVVILAV